MTTALTITGISALLAGSLLLYIYVHSLRTPPDNDIDGEGPQ